MKTSIECRADMENGKLTSITLGGKKYPADLTCEAVRVSVSTVRDGKEFPTVWEVRRTDGSEDDGMGEEFDFEKEREKIRKLHEERNAMAKMLQDMRQAAADGLRDFANGRSVIKEDIPALREIAKIVYIERSDLKEELFQKEWQLNDRDHTIREYRKEVKRQHIITICLGTLLAVAGALLLITACTSL